jgi:RNA polymerase sigma-70 factor (ECF subfamily)
VKRIAHSNPPASAEHPDSGPTLELLYRQHFHWLVRVLRVRYGPDGAEDLVQETYLRAASIQSLAKIQSPRALLLRIATNVAIDQHRRACVRPTMSRSEAAALAFERHAVAGDQGELLALKQTILSLPHRLQEAFVLSRFAGLTYEEIADRLGLSVKTVEGRMTKALRICARQLEKDRVP